MLQKIIHTDDQKTTILIRLMVGAVFLSEGIQKFMFADKLGSGRFVKIGLPNPDFLGPFVGTTKTEVLANEGFWSMMHGSRTDWSMLLGSSFVLIKGAGKWSVDNSLQRQQTR